MLDTDNVTVIIPTCNSGKHVSRVLDRLYKESSSAPKQVIVVDGHSTDSTVVKAREYPVEIYFESDRNVATARNVGIKHSKNRIIAFTDSDCVPDREWIERITNCFQNNQKLVGVGGRLLPLEPRNDIEAFSGKVFLNEIMKFPPQIVRPYQKFLPGSFITANCAYRRETLMDIGGFNDFFRNNGEDIDLFWRVVDRFPGRLLYDPSIVVYHNFPDTYIGLIKKYFQYGLASSKLAKSHLKTPRIDTIIYRRLCENLTDFLNPLSSLRKQNFLYLIQLNSHLLGKIFGSLLVRRLNL